MGKEIICPKCQEKVPEGYLYCPRCLAEVPWVKEYNTIETLFEKNNKTFEVEKEANEEADEDESELFDDTIIHYGRKHRIIFIICLFVILLGAFFVLLFLHMRSYGYLHVIAEEAYEEGDYEKALKNMTDALVKNPDDKEGNLFLVSIFEAMGDIESAALVLKPMISQYPDDGAIFKQYLDFLYEQNKMEEIKDRMDQCTNPEIREFCKEYICDPPQISLPGGVYTTLQKITLTADYEEIYYSLGDVTPLILYTGEFTLPEGTHTLSVVGVNKKGIYSEIESVEYTVSLTAPAPPKISPESGTYHKMTKIEIEVPKGCKVYYSFDQDPNKAGIEYNAPVNMPQGAHSFMAICVGANGKASEITRMEYYLEY